MLVRFRLTGEYFQDGALILDSVDLEFVPGYTRSEGIVRIVTKVYTFFLKEVSR